MASFIGSQAGKMALGKMMQGQQGKGPSPRHAMNLQKYGTAKDMSQSANMGGLLNMINSMPQQPQRQNGSVQIDEYIKSLLG